jgi:gamma-glutamylcyclotransferase (GGCT)/AIG2-like uncharacterized protein YtfP
MSTLREQQDPSAELLFVYGTLKRGHSNHARLAGALFCGEAATAPGFVLFRSGPYPVLVRGGQGRVLGEVYAVDAAAIAALDEFEGCPWLYQRVHIELADGQKAHAYVMPESRLEECQGPIGEFWS